MVDEFAGKGFGDFKPALADLVIESIRPIRDRLARLESDPAELERILRDGAAKAKDLAAPTLEAAFRAVGLPR